MAPANSENDDLSSTNTMHAQMMDEFRCNAMPNECEPEDSLNCLHCIAFDIDTRRIKEFSQKNYFYRIYNVVSDSLTFFRFIGVLLDFIIESKDQYKHIFNRRPTIRWHDKQTIGTQSKEKQVTWGRENSRDRAKKNENGKFYATLR